MEQAEYCRYQEERRHCGDDEPSYHRAAKRSILLAAFTQSQGHGDHADDHGKGRHENGAQAADSGFPCRRERVQT